MAIYHCRVKVVSRSGGRSIISASAYRNASKMYDKETGLTYDYSRKRNVIDSEILYCKNAPEEWKEVPEKAIKEFMKSAKYKKSSDKEEAIEWFCVRYKKERLWNEVLLVENYSNAQLARELEVAIPYECSKEDSKKLVHDFVQKHLVDDGMCADIVWHNPDKETKNPHAHILVTMRPILENGKWAPKETKEYAKDENGNKIPVIDPATGEQKLGKRNEKIWKRITVQKNYWNSEEKLMEWREAWATECNRYLAPENHIDHRSYKDRGIDKIATLHEGYAARKVEEDGQTSWVCELNRDIKSANTDSAVLMLRTGWAVNDLESILKNMEEEKNVAARRKERTVDDSAGREPGDSTIVRTGSKTEEPNIRLVDAIKERGKIDVRGSKSAKLDDGFVRIKREAELREQDIEFAAKTINATSDYAERGISETVRGFTERTRTLFRERIRNFAESFGRFVEGCVRKIENRVEELKELATKYRGISQDNINIEESEQEIPEGQNNNMKRRKGR